ncbi:odorant receptor 131-2-like [Pholidichthys leucotaenia]
MSFVNWYAANVSVGLQHRGVLERALFCTLTTLPCCVFLFINGTMLFTLRSKSVFRETSRYILLCNLLFADTGQMALSQILYIIAASRITLTYPLCGFLNMLTFLVTTVSPLTLVLMSLERYVAVCYPLRHTAIVSIKNTWVTIAAVWAISSLNVLTRVLLLLEFPFEQLQSLQMKDFCSEIAMLLGSKSAEFNKVFTSFLFISSSVVITSTYISVMVAARSASTEKTSVHKVRNTLLLHLVQLSLILCSTVYSSLLISLSRVLQRIVFVRIQIFLYISIFIFPRCLSSLIYGIRDQSIRPVLIYHLCCRLKLRSGPVKVLLRSGMDAN